MHRGNCNETTFPSKVQIRYTTSPLSDTFLDIIFTPQHGKVSRAGNNIGPHHPLISELLLRLDGKPPSRSLIG